MTELTTRASTGSSVSGDASPDKIKKVSPGQTHQQFTTQQWWRIRSRALRSGVYSARPQSRTLIRAID